MDATHETNGYNFHLIPVLTKDAHGEGLPLAHMFSSRKTAVALKYFLKGIKSECGSIKCAAFMSDDADQYFQAWSSVMVENGDPPVKLLCAWHVTRLLERNILLTVKEKKYKEFVNHHLKWNDLTTHWTTWLHFLKMRVTTILSSLWKAKSLAKGQSLRIITRRLCNCRTNFTLSSTMEFTFWPAKTMFTLFHFMEKNAAKIHAVFFTKTVKTFASTFLVPASKIRFISKCASIAMWQFFTAFVIAHVDLILSSLITNSIMIIWFCHHVNPQL